MRHVSRLMLLALLVATVVPVAFADNVIPPRSIHRVAPLYPAEARMKGVKGTLEVRAVIDEKGAVTNIEVTRGLPLKGGYGLEKAAVDALKQWKYEPATLDGKPVPVKFAMTFRF